MISALSQTNLSTTSHNDLQKLLQRVVEGNLEAVQKCLSSAQFEEGDLNKAIFVCISNYNTLRNHAECLFILLRQKKANPNCIVDDRTPLINACAGGQEALVRCLLENGAKPDTPDSQGRHPLFFIMDTDCENYDAAELLIDRMQTANINIVRKVPALVFAIQKEHEKIAKKLIEKGANLGVLSEQGDTIMHIVCKKQFSKIAKQKRLIRLLVSKVSNLQVRNKENKTPIEYLNNEELRQMIMESTKPRYKQKQKERKKQQALQPQEEQISEDYGEELEEYANRKDSKDEQIQKKLDDIEQESEEEKRDELDKDKEKHRPRKSITTNIIYTGKARDLKQSKNTTVKTVYRPKEKTSSKFEKKVSGKTGKPVIKVQPLVISREKEKQLKERELQRELQQKEEQLSQILERNRNFLQRIEKLQKQVNLRKQQNGNLHSESLYFQHCASDCFLSKQIISEILTKEMIYFVEEQTEKCQRQAEVNFQIIRIIKELFDIKLPDIKAQIYLYGSQSSGLSLQFSDVDLVIVLTAPVNLNIFAVIEDSRIFDDPEYFKDAKYIRNATIPIVKLQTAGKFRGRKVDITFQTSFHNGIRCNTLLNQFMAAQPLIRPLVLVIKMFMYCRNMNDTYTGGLGSYSIVLMVVALLQSTTLDKNHPHSLGRMLIQFLFFYGYQMDYICKSILLYSPEFKEPVCNVFPLPNTHDLTPKLIIHDPLNPVNNVGRSTYRIMEIKHLFMQTYNLLFFNRRCLDRNCRWRHLLTNEQKSTYPCCLLARVFN